MTETTHRTKQSLSLARRRLVELMQELNFGRIEGLQVRDGETSLVPPPSIRREILFGKENAPNAARGKEDFTLKNQHVELFALFDRERSVTIESLVVQNGLPIRMTVANPARVG